MMIDKILKDMYGHTLGLFRGRWDADRLRNANAIFKMRSLRGKQMFDGVRDITLWFNMYVILSLKWPWLEIWMFSLLIPVYIVTMYFLGYFDERYLGFWQKEREKADTHANPFTLYVKTSLSEIKDTVASIERELLVDK